MRHVRRWNRKTGKSVFIFLPLQFSICNFPSPFLEIDVYLHIFWNNFHPDFSSERKKKCVHFTELKKWGKYSPEETGNQTFYFCLDFKMPILRPTVAGLARFIQGKDRASLWKRPVDTNICGLYLWYKTLTGHHS